MGSRGQETRARPGDGLLAALARSADAIEALPEFSRAAAEVDPRVTATSIVLLDDTETVAAVGAWPEDVSALATRQFRERQGPCYEAWSQQEPVTEADVAGAGVRRWPSWARAAADLGLATVSSRPLRRRGRVVGSLLTATADGVPLDRSLLEDIECAAQMAVELAMTFRDLSDARVHAAQLQHALNSRVVIEQAKGRLSADLDCTVDEAFEWLRRHARSTNRKLHDLASEVVEGRMSTNLAQFPPNGAQAGSGALTIELTAHGLRLVGQADPVDAAAVSARLHVAAAASTRTVVDLSQLEACDTAVAQALIDARVRAQPRASVILDSPRAPVATLLQALGASDLPGVTIRGAATP